jgi:hypothetical protein
LITLDDEDDIDDDVIDVAVAGVAAVTVAEAEMDGVGVLGNMAPPPSNSSVDDSSSSSSSFTSLARLCVALLPPEIGGGSPAIAMH